MSKIRDYFLLFKIEKDTDVDLDLLDLRYYQMLSELHPDSMKSISSNTNVEISAQDLNRAYKILRDDHQRLAHILHFEGFTREAEIKDSEFLMKFLEYQEYFEDLGSDIVTLTSFAEKIKKEREDLISALKLDVKNKEYEQAHEKLTKLNFYRRMINQILDKESELEAIL